MFPVPTGRAFSVSPCAPVRERFFIFYTLSGAPSISFACFSFSALSAAVGNGEKNKADGQAYAEKMVKEGYTKTASGLVYKMINEGTGETFNADQSIDIKYEGKLIDGKVFDATQGEETRSMAPGQVVPGFREALMLMKPGAKMIAVIPGDLAYGAEGRGDIIGPNATLVFTIETVGVHTAE